MIGRVDFQQLSPGQRADLIYTEARSELARNLWRAALGTADRAEPGRASLTQTSAVPFDSLLQMLAREATASPANAPMPANRPPAGSDAAADDGTPAAAPISGEALTGVDGLGPNGRYRSTLESAAEQSGVPASALAAIVDAEAAKNHDGSWNPHSRNPRSSAAGLGQFLSSTWTGLAEQSGTWLNATAKAHGWVGQNGRVTAAGRAPLLALRYDPEASIRGIADFARSNLDRLEKKGVQVGDNVTTVARAAYLSHHLGLGDAVRFLKDGIPSARAGMLLRAQVGNSAAERKIASAGNAQTAHREWLLAYIDRKIRPAAFAA